MKKALLAFVLIAVILTVAVGTTAYNNALPASPSFDNPPVEVLSARWLLGTGEDNSQKDFSAKWDPNLPVNGSPWIYLELVIKNVSGRAIQNILYSRHYTAWHQEGDGLGCSIADGLGGDVLETGNALKAGEIRTVIIPVLSWKSVDWISQDEYSIELIDDSYIVIYWVNYRGFGSWGDKMASLDNMGLIGAIKAEVDDWKYIN